MWTKRNRLYIVMTQTKDTLVQVNELPIFHNRNPSD